MPHLLSADDRAFQSDFEDCRVRPEDFDHRAHVRLAYIYLAGHDTGHALQHMREALHRFIRHNDIPVAKYHETMTHAWILAVRHFMAQTGSAESAAEFIDAHPQLLDSRIMLSHYSAEVLFSPEARARFVEPDLDGIPRHDE